MLPTDFLETLKREYPVRDGDNGWVIVRTLVPRIIAWGEGTWDQVISGTRKYREHCRKNSLLGTNKVYKAKTFYGPDGYWLEWAEMEQVKSPAELAAQTHWERALDRAKAINFRMPYARGGQTIEPLAAYETSLRDAERDQQKLGIVVDLVKAKRVP